MKEKLGVDLGTSNVVVARMVGNEPTAVPLQDGIYLPSYVGLSGPNDLRPVVGKAARDRWFVGDEGYYRGFKLDMGAGVEYSSGATPKLLTRRLMEGLHPILRQQSGGAVEVGEIVVSVPHGWDSLDSPRRLETLQAVTDAGFTVYRLISEPVAAAAYHL
ncbi:MAG: hypothetical protein WKH64_17145, partial [Chloroflexia bacterium]